MVDGLLLGVPQIMIPGKVSGTAEKVSNNTKTRENAQSLGIRFKESGGAAKMIKEMIMEI